MKNKKGIRYVSLLLMLLGSVLFVLLGFAFLAGVSDCGNSCPSLLEESGRLLTYTVPIELLFAGISLIASGSVPMYRSYKIKTQIWKE